MCRIPQGCGCGTVTIFYASGSDFWQVPVPVPYPDHKKQFLKKIWKNPAYPCFTRKKLKVSSNFIVKSMWIKKMCNEEIKFYTVSVRTFVIPFNYGSGSDKVRNYITVPVPLRQKVTVPVPQHWGTVGTRYPPTVHWYIPTQIAECVASLWAANEDQTFFAKPAMFCNMKSENSQNFRRMFACYG